MNFLCRPSDSTVSDDDGLKPSTVATLTLAVKRSNHSARSNQSPSIRAILKVGCACLFFTLQQNDDAGLQNEDAGIEPRTGAPLSLAVKLNQHCFICRPSD
jgi:hypothetical protein